VRWHRLLIDLPAAIVDRLSVVGLILIALILLFAVQAFRELSAYPPEPQRWVAPARERALASRSPSEESGSPSPRPPCGS